MATYIVMFRIEFDESYSERWDSVVSAIRREAIDGITWEEMTSVIVIKSQKSAEDLARDIYVNSSFDVAKDKLVAVNAGTGEAAKRGTIQSSETFRRMFPVSNALSFLFGA
ncbi:MAG: hypothetical protein RIB50_19955 [Marinovum algicola]|uniref:hypothetical protein n=1 Tax=Marinovum algicola TaxID=42444 RepID=UPI0032EE4B94